MEGEIIEGMQQEINSFFLAVVPHVHRKKVSEEKRSIDFDLILDGKYTGWIKIYEHYDGVSVTTWYHRSHKRFLESVDLLDEAKLTQGLILDETRAIHKLLPEVVERLAELNLHVPPEAMAIAVIAATT